MPLSPPSSVKPEQSAGAVPAPKANKRREEPLDKDGIRVKYFKPWEGALLDVAEQEVGPQVREVIARLLPGLREEWSSNVAKRDGNKAGLQRDFLALVMPAVKKWCEQNRPDEVVTTLRKLFMGWAAKKFKLGTLEGETTHQGRRHTDVLSKRVYTDENRYRRSVDIVRQHTGWSKQQLEDLHARTRSARPRRRSDKGRRSTPPKTDSSDTDDLDQRARFGRVRGMTRIALRYPRRGGGSRRPPLTGTEFDARGRQCEALTFVPARSSSVDADEDADRTSSDDDTTLPSSEFADLTVSSPPEGYRRLKQKSRRKVHQCRQCDLHKAERDNALRVVEALQAELRVLRAAAQRPAALAPTPYGHRLGLVLPPQPVAPVQHPFPLPSSFPAPPAMPALPGAGGVRPGHEQYDDRMGMGAPLRMVEPKNEQMHGVYGNDSHMVADNLLPPATPVQGLPDSAMVPFMHGAHNHGFPSLDGFNGAYDVAMPPKCAMSSASPTNNLGVFGA